MNQSEGQSRRRLEESRFFRLSSEGPRFTSAVLIDGWWRRSIWGRDDGRFFLTLWRDDTPPDAEPDLWISVADRHPLYSAGCVALALNTRIDVDPVTASAGLQILSPAPATDPSTAIEQIASRELSAIKQANGAQPDDFTLGEWSAYKWVAGQISESPASNHHYPFPTPGYREIVAEWNSVTGLIYQLSGHEAGKYYEGVESALATIVRSAIA